MAIMNIFMLFVKIIITVYFSVPRCNVEVLYIIMHVCFFRAAMQSLCMVSPHAAVLMMDDDLLIPGPDIAFALQTWKVSTIP